MIYLLLTFGRGKLIHVLTKQFFCKYTDYRLFQRGKVLVSLPRGVKGVLETLIIS